MEVIENTMEMSYSILFGSPLYEERIKDKNKNSSYFIKCLLRSLSFTRFCVVLHHLVTVLIAM